MTLPVFFGLTSRACVAVQGEGWRAFLQNLLSNDVEALPEGEARAALLLTPQGKLLFDLIVIAGRDGAVLDVLASRREELVRRLTVYRLRAKLTFILLDDHVWAATGADPGPGWIADPRLPVLGWRRYGAEPPPGQANDEPAYRVHCLALGVPDPERDCTPDKTFPLEADFDLLNAIDFHKGC